ncbi:MAG: UDP-2,3-diacylglucosamine diphosphatase [Xanthomonadales bacterium]|nr:UDP-2,3-diacylglucosamine diphosphatase [Xanthomonadales bacterium]
MTCVFISDLHLDEAEPTRTTAFESYLAGLPAGTRALYILGDLFESWIGDDDDAGLPARVAQALRTLADRGVAVHFMAGNRDFALGPDYAARAGMTLIADPTRIDLAGAPALLMHGDTLCTDDTAYQAFRAQVRDPAWLAGMLAQPLDVRRAYAARARAGSRAHAAGAPETIMDVNADAVAQAFRAHDVDLLIHGHTHRPAVHHDDVDGRTCRRIVLGDWYDQGTVLQVEDDGRMQLARIDHAGT